MARSQRPVSAALVVVVSLAALLVAGRWLQPRLDGPTPAPATTRPAPTTPEPAPTSPTLATTRPAGTSQIRRVVATSSPVDAIAVAGQWVWLAVGGLVLRVDPGSARLTAPNPGPVSAIAAGAFGVWAVCCRGRGPRGRVTRLDPASGRVIATIGLPARPLSVGAGSGMVWVRSANRWLWRVDPTYGRQVGSIRLASVAGGAELAGELVVARAAVWISDPGPGVVRRVDLRRETEDLFEADGRDLAVTPGGTVWATSHTRLLGLGGSEVRGPAVPCTSCTPIGSPRWRPRPMVGCGWARPRDCSTSTSASWASGSTARVIPRASPPSHMGARRPRYWPRCRPCRPC